MRLAEFTAYWAGNYTPEQEQTYRVLHGDDKESWPKTNDNSPITIDLDLVCRFNPHHDEDKTTVELSGSFSYSLLVTYDDFKMIIKGAREIKSYVK